jgi:hypothetical protein
MADMPELLRQMIRHFAEGSPPLTRLRLFAAAMAEGTGGAKKQLAVHCEVAQMLARRVGLRHAVGECVAHVFERWDGKGLPGELAGEAIPIAARIVAAARDVDVLYRLGGWELVDDVLRRRRARTTRRWSTCSSSGASGRSLQPAATPSGRPSSPASRVRRPGSASRGSTRCCAPSPTSPT